MIASARDTGGHARSTACLMRPRRDSMSQSSPRGPERLVRVYAALVGVDLVVPTEPFHAVYCRCRQAIADVLLSEAIASDALPPHMTLAYGTGPPRASTARRPHHTRQSDTCYDQPARTHRGLTTV